MPKKIKKPNRRARERFPALKPEFNLKSRKEYIDYDYLGKLSDKDKEWLNKFTEEYVNASFKKKPLHKTKAMKKDCYDRNNARNRCILTKSKASGKNVYLEELKDFDIAQNGEEAIIDQLDDKRSSGKDQK